MTRKTRSRFSVVRSKVLNLLESLGIAVTAESTWKGGENSHRPGKFAGMCLDLIRDPDLDNEHPDRPQELQLEISMGPKSYDGKHRLYAQAISGPDCRGVFIPIRSTGEHDIASAVLEAIQSHDDVLLQQKRRLEQFRKHVLYEMRSASDESNDNNWTVSEPERMASSWFMTFTRNDVDRTLAFWVHGNDIGVFVTDVSELPDGAEEAIADSSRFMDVDEQSFCLVLGQDWQKWQSAVVRMVEDIASSDTTEVRYVGGPLDGDTEKRQELPSDGEPVHRRIGEATATYRFSSEQGAFLYTAERKSE